MEPCLRAVQGCETQGFGGNVGPPACLVTGADNSFEAQNAFAQFLLVVQSNAVDAGQTFSEEACPVQDLLFDTSVGCAALPDPPLLFLLLHLRLICNKHRTSATDGDCAYACLSTRSRVLPCLSLPAPRL